MIEGEDIRCGVAGEEGNEMKGRMICAAASFSFGTSLYHEMVIE